MIREALAGRIAKEPDMQVCGEAANLTETLTKVKTTNPDLMIVDLCLKEGHGIDLIKRVLAQNDKVNIIVHSMYGEETYAERSLRAGAMGYINKQTNPQIIVDAVRRVLEGKIYLSPKMTDRMAQLAIQGRGPATGDPVERLSDRELEVFENK